VATYIVIKMWRFKDSFYILQELKITIIVGYLAIIFFIIDTGFDAAYLTAITIIYLCFFTVSFTWPVILSYKTKKAQDNFYHSADLLKTDMDFNSVEKILQNSEACDLYQKFLVNELSVENLLFVQIINRFRILTDEEEIKTKANEIYTHFIIEGSINETNLDFQIRDSIKKKFASKNIDNTIFNEAYKATIDLMDSDSLIRFRKSFQFIKMIKELKN